MPNNFDFLPREQRVRALCVSMAIDHLASDDREPDAVVVFADAFEGYIRNGTKPAVGNGQTTGDGASEPVIGLNAGLGTLDHEPLLDTAVDKAAAPEKDKTAAGSVSQTENEKREIEQKLAAAQRLGVRLVSVEVIDAKPQAEWHFNGTDNLFLGLLVSTAVKDISSKIGKVFGAGFIIRAVHYDDAGFPCVSWARVSAAA